MVKMSKRDRLSAIQEIRCWSTEQLQKFLTDHGLGECCTAIGKREVDGAAFLALSEGQLAFWKRDLNLATIRKMVQLVQDVNAQPEKYAQAESNIVGHGKLSAVDVPRGVSHIRNKQQVSSVSRTRTPPSDSWDTDFSDDDVGDISKEVETEPVYCNEALENVEMYSNSEALASEEMYTNGEKPPVPVRPPALALKPASTAVADSNSHNLPKPPIPVESIRSLVSTLHLPEHTDQFDEEYYESWDKEVPDANKTTLAALLKKELEDRAQAAANKPPVLNAQPNKQTENVPSQNRTIVETAQHVSAFPQETHKLRDIEGHINHGYDSEEYESIKENEKSTHLPPGGGEEYYLQPVHKQQSTGGAPPLPAKPWTKPADATLPISKPPSPPKTKLDDGPNSPGSSGDGATGWFGGILRKRRSPGTSNHQDSRERTPTPDVKKATTFPASSHKPSLVDRPPGTFQSTQRPLPPTPGDTKLSEKSSVARSRRISQQPWYHDVDRRQAEEMVHNAEDGCFLVRPSSQSQNPLTLTLWYKRRPYNISIRQRSDGRCALGTEKTNEQSFASVEDLIQNYQAEKLVLYSGGEKVGRTLLTTSPPQGYKHSM